MLRHSRADGLLIRRDAPDVGLGGIFPLRRKDTSKPDKRRKYDAAFRAEALRLAAQSRSAHAAASALNSDPKRLYQWRKAAQTPVAAALGASLDPATAAELRQLRAANRRQAQELDMLKKPLPVACCKRRLSQTPDQ